MTVRALIISLLFCGACNNSGDRPVVVGGYNQGNFTVRSEPNPMDSMPRETPPRPSGPTTREIEQQRRITELEAQSKALNAEIERLKANK